MILALIAMLEATSAFYGYAGYGYGRGYGYGHRYGYGYGLGYRRAEVDNVSGELEVPTEEEVPRRRGYYWGRRRGYGYGYSRPYAPVVEGSEDKKRKKTEDAADWYGYRRAEEDVPEDEIPEDEIEVAPERLPIEVSLATPIQRHPEDCTVYFIYNIPYQCPEGMAFDMKDLVCVEEDAADCPRPTPCDLKTSRE